MRKLSLTLLTVIITTGLFFTSCVSSRQTIASPETKVKNVVNKSDKNSNYIKANEWMVQAFGDAESVIQFTDKEAGIVKGKYVMKQGAISTSAYVQSTPSFYAIITIRVKDEACRIEIVAPTGMYSQKVMGVETGFTPEMFNTSSDLLIADFETNMLKKSANDSW